MNSFRLDGWFLIPLENEVVECTINQRAYELTVVGYSCKVFFDNCRLPVH